MEGSSLSSVEASDTQQISFDDSDFLHLLLDNSQDCIYYKDKESRFIKVNKKTVEVLGAENSKEVIGKSNDDFFPDIADRTRADELHIMETGQPQLNEEMNIRFADGHMHWVSVSKVPFYDDQGNIAGIVGISRDITYKKNLELSYKSLFDTVKSGVAVYEPIKNGKDFIFKDFNIAAEKIEGKKRENVIGKLVSEVFPGIKDFRIFKVFQQVNKTGKAEFFSEYLYKDDNDPSTWRESWVYKLPSGEIISFYDDVTEKKKYEEKLEEYQATLLSILENTEDVICLRDKNHKLIYFNEPFEKITKKLFNINVKIGLNTLDYLPKKKASYWKNNLSRVLVGEQHQEEFEWDYGNGDVRFYQISFNPIERNGEVIGYSEFTRDVTEYKKVEKALQKKENRLKETEQIGRIGNGSWDVKKNQIYWSEVMYDLYERDPKLGPPSYNEILALHHPDSAKLLQKAVKNAVEKKEGYNIDLKVILPSGKIAYHSVIGKPVKDEKQNVIRLISTVQDITKRKKIEQDIRDKAEDLKEAQDIAVLGSWIWDPNENTIQWSDKLYDIFGVDRAFPLSFDSISEMVHPDDREKNREKVSTLLKDGHVDPFEIRIINPNGKIKWIYQKIITKNDGSGKVKWFKGTIQDITKRKKIEIKLKKSEERFKILFENAPDGIYLMDMKGRFVDGNRAAEKICGYEKEDLIGKNLFESKLLSKKQLPIALKIVARNKLGKASGPDDLILLSKTGKKIFIEIHTYPIKIENKRYILGIARDITYRKKAEHTLKESEEKLRNLVEATSEFIWEVDKNGVYTFVSENCSDIIGFPASEVIGKTPFDFMNDIEAERVGRLFSDLIKEKKKISRLEDAWIHKDGTEIVFETDATPLFDEKGDVTGYFGICRDITKRKNDEKIIKESEEKFRTLFNSSTDAYCIQSIPELKILDVNDEACKRFGYSKEEFKDLTVDDLSVTPKFSMEHEENKRSMQKVFDGEIQNWEWLSKTKSGEHIWHLMTLKTIEIDGEKCLLAQAKDITDIRKYQDQLENHKVILQTVNKELTRKVKERTREIEKLLKQKDEFINQLGHDLKNPLGPFVQLLPILKRHAETDKDKEIIDVLDRNAWYMRNLVKKTIELAKLNSSKTVFLFEPTDISKLIKNIIKINKPLFDENKISVENNISKSYDLQVDPLHIQEVFTNLFNNAVKYSDGPGTITIDAKKQKDQLLVSIKDTGIGIDDEQMQYLFDEYYKADKSRHDFDSSGLGLPICKRIIEKHNGKIWAESKGIGKGSTFYFTLPFSHDDE